MDTALGKLIQPDVRSGKTSRSPTKDSFLEKINWMAAQSGVIDLATVVSMQEEYLTERIATFDQRPPAYKSVRLEDYHLLQEWLATIDPATELKS